MPSGSDDVIRHYDLVVIGAGPAGEAAAELAGNLGYQVALVERDTVGGTLVTSGGAPTKTFREAATYLSSFEKERVYGVALSAPPEVMYPAVRARARQDVVRMVYNTPTYTYGYQLAAADTLARLHPDVLRAMRLPSQAHRI